tara:strand:- start:4734 stop:5525 length:792 start_codon:yes stop_codon:yes gene_type:complete
MSKLKNRKPKVKFRSYGSGEKLPIVKSDGNFYLADQSYENIGHGDFIGQNTTKLEGPSKRAIRGKGKKSKNVRVYNDKGDPIFLEDTSSMKRMMTPMKQEDGFDYGDKNRAKTEKDKYGFTKDEKKKISKNLKSQNKQAKQDNKEKAKTAKEKAKSSPEAIAKKEDRKAKATDIVHSLGRAMEAFGTGKSTAAPSKTKTEELAEDREKKTTKPSDNLKIDKSDGLATLDNTQKKDNSKSPATRRDMALMRKAMQKIKKPLHKY